MPDFCPFEIIAYHSICSKRNSKTDIHKVQYTNTLSAHKGIKYPLHTPGTYTTRGVPLLLFWLQSLCGSLDFQKQSVKYAFQYVVCLELFKARQS